MARWNRDLSLSNGLPAHMVVDLAVKPLRALLLHGGGDCHLGSENREAVGDADFRLVGEALLEEQ